MADIDIKKHLSEIKYLSSLGLSEKQIASKLSLHHAVLRYHRNNDPEVEAAFQEGLTSTILIATERLQKLITQGDFKAIKFFLEKKGGWQDTVHITERKLPSRTDFKLTKIEKDGN